MKFALYGIAQGIGVSIGIILARDGYEWAALFLLTAIVSSAYIEGRNGRRAA